MSFNLSKVFVCFKKDFQVLKRERVPYPIPGQKVMILSLKISVINASLVAFSSLQQELIQL